MNLSNLTFEVGCQISTLGIAAFHGSSLVSVCLPSSIETIPGLCFACCRNLSKFTFEPGREILDFRDFSFSPCPSRQSLCIPAGVREIRGLRGLAVSAVTVDSGNEFFRLSGDFLVDSGGRSLCKYFGTERRVDILSDIESISRACFADCNSLWSVRFAGDCRVLNLGDNAFQSCSSLQSICVPSSVEAISKCCFCSCRNLRNLSFQSGSRLLLLGESAFVACASLPSICIPLSVATIAESCFIHCDNLSGLTFEPGSEPALIGDNAFADCQSLHAICIPARVREVRGLAMARSGIRNVTVASGNQFFRVSGPFLVDFGGTCLIRYFGPEGEVAIATDAKSIAPGCFSGYRSLFSVSFASDCSISNLAERCFFFIASIDLHSFISRNGFRLLFLRLPGSFECDFPSWLYGFDAWERRIFEMFVNPIGFYPFICESNFQILLQLVQKPHNFRFLTNLHCDSWKICICVLSSASIALRPLIHRNNGQLWFLSLHETRDVDVRAGF
jgi:hypothetical protein